MIREAKVSSKRQAMTPLDIRQGLIVGEGGEGDRLTFETEDDAVTFRVAYVSFRQPCTS